MKVLVSCHYDTVFKEPFGEVLDGILEGACDNIAGVLACARLIDEPDLEIQFTEEEEMHMDGARCVAKENKPEETFIIVVDVTERKRRWKKINFTVENINGIMIKHIKKALKDFNGRYKIVEKGAESEAWLYKEMGFACAEIDVPVTGGLHNLQAKARVEDIIAVGGAIKALKDYVLNKSRAELSDIYRVGENNG